MDDQVAMGVVDGGAHFFEECEAAGDGEGAAVLVDRTAVDQFRGEVGEAFGGGSGVDQAGDVGVPETVQGRGDGDDPNGYRVASVDALGAVDGIADFVGDPVWSEGTRPSSFLVSPGWSEMVRLSRST